MQAEQAWEQRRRDLVRTGHELRGLLASPAQRQAWLTRARRARISLAVVVLLGLFVVPWVTGGLADSIFEPRQSRRLFSRSVSRNPSAETLQWLLQLGFWLGGLGLVARQAWRERPDGVLQPDYNDAPFPTSSGVHTGAGQPSPGVAQASAELATMMATEAPQSRSGHAPGTGPSASAPLLAGPTLGPGGAAALAVRYRIDSELGRGGMGVVYRATDTVLDRTVALKSLPAEMLGHGELVARFQREAKVLAALTHPNIVGVFDLVQQDGQLYMAMELVQGRDLAGVLEAQGALPQDQALAIALQCAHALSHAHAQGIVHRDFKPDNVLLTADGTAKVTDFGIAKAQDKPQMTQAGAVMGTPYYMSPEQATGADVDARTDLYALGATLYELLSGSPPFVGNTAQVLMMHLSQQPDPLNERAPQLDARVCELVHALLQKDREQRPRDMGEVAAVLEGLRPALSA